jgi:hypothetical protein
MIIFFAIKFINAELSLNCYFLKLFVPKLCFKKVSKCLLHFNN